MPTATEGSCRPTDSTRDRDIQDDVANHVGSTRILRNAGALETADREERIDDWLDEHGIAEGWHYAPTFAEAGSTSVAATSLDVPQGGAAKHRSVLQRAVGWLKDSVDTELRLREIIDASKRMSALLAGAKQYSQMDRGAYQRVDVHELLRSTLLMFDGRVGANSEIRSRHRVGSVTA